MTFITVFNKIAILFLMIVVGYGIKKLGILNEEMNKGLSNLVLKVTLPAMIIKSMQFEFSKEVLFTSFKMILLSLLVHGIAILISYFVYRLLKAEEGKKDIIQFMLIFSNVGYMGYPVIYAVYGEMGVFYTALFNIPFNFLIWTLGVTIMTRNREGGSSKLSYFKVLMNPGIISVILGFMLFLFSVKIPIIMYETLHVIGEMTVPLSMFIIGSMLGALSIYEIFNEKQLFMVSVVRLLVIPIVTMVVLQVMGFEDILLGVPFLIAGMPAAANTAVFASMYNREPIFASKGVLITTLLSMLTIPILTMLL